MQIDGSASDLNIYFNLAIIYMEIWKCIVGFDKYYISNIGRIKNIKTNRILKISKGLGGYYRINIKNRSYFIHRLVAIAFIEKIRNKNIINHIDNNILNNNVENLEWCNQSENIKHAYNTGRAMCNIKHKNGRFYKSYD